MIRPLLLSLALLAVAVGLAAAGAPQFMLPAVFGVGLWWTVRAASIRRGLWHDERPTPRWVLDRFGTTLVATVAALGVLAAGQAQTAARSASTAERLARDNMQASYAACRSRARTALATRDVAALTERSVRRLADVDDLQRLKSSSRALGAVGSLQVVPDCERLYPAARHHPDDARTAYRAERAEAVFARGGPPPRPDPPAGVVP